MCEQILSYGLAWYNIKCICEFYDHHNSGMCRLTKSWSDFFQKYCFIQLCQHSLNLVFCKFSLFLKYQWKPINKIKENTMKQLMMMYNWNFCASFLRYWKRAGYNLRISYKTFLFSFLICLNFTFQVSFYSILNFRLQVFLICIIRGCIWK